MCTFIISFFKDPTDPFSYMGKYRLVWKLGDLEMPIKIHTVVIAKSIENDNIEWV